jgi:DNA repair exonuclease SbcCD ATPase subunit
MTDEQALKLSKDAERLMDQVAQVLNQISDGGYEVDARFSRTDVTTLGDAKRRYVHVPVVEVIKTLSGGRRL